MESQGGNTQLPITNCKDVALLRLYTPFARGKNPHYKKSLYGGIARVKNNAYT